ncbi:MAG: putative cytochrome c [Candidatus Scalindua rubra]|uniref:Putative cytochrome c n=1 Tax=Candidatus Scalindua rubra TaxID=1872076 RepID=A0A1E3X5U4_9BACT|nr:MAG: putative cytochrome c [Candidatus Scalindua rubra]
MGHYVKLILLWLTTISIIFILLLGVSGVWSDKEFNPEWKQHQRAVIQEKIAKAEESYEFWSNPEWGDPEKAKELENKIRGLKNKKLEIKQILLKGEGLWSNQENGPRFDRCMTCHIDEERIKEDHPENLPLPYDIYGCMVCHDGNGMALEKEPAHEHMLADREAMREARERSADALIKMWQRIAKLNPEKEIKLREVSFYGPTGEYQIYVGNIKCIKCHKKTHPEHVNLWSESKFKTTERIQKEPDFQKGDENYRKKCYKCHTTGYKEDKGTFEELGVGCEACHGPGEVYSELMEGEKTIEEARKLTRISFDYNIFSNCHITKRHEMRKEYFEW